MKKYWSFLAVLFVMVMLCAGTAFANETCEYATDGTACEIWYFYDNEYHWQACVNHKDVYGNDAKISEAEEHTFEEGKCSVCDAKETKGSSRMYYYIVLIIVGMLGLFASARSRTTFKDAKLDQRPFALDKFKKR